MDLLPQFPGDELIVGTISGDIIVFTIDPSNNALSESWRTFVPGAGGCYQGIAVEDLDGDGTKELYVASSSGLWRFIQP
ncbi:MAG: hypothetical protein R3F29_08260 [Planctomycetota bacterium]